MSAADRHDPLADPLTPYWRAKVEAAAAGLPMPNEALPRPDFSPFPRGVDPDPRDALFAKLWNAGAPYYAITMQMKFGHMSRCHAWSQRLRYLGYSLFHRGMGWKPPPDWQQRVDRIIELGG